MAAPKGNQFWKLAPKCGRERSFSSPEILWDAACEYFEATDERKWVTVEFNGKDATECHVPNETPYTISGLCVFLGCDRRTLLNYETDEKYKEFFPIVTRIKEIMFTQKFEGAAVGAFNSSIIARDLGLVDKSGVEHSGEIKDVTVTIKGK